METKKIQSATKIRIYPNKEQTILLAKHFGSARFIYNYFLDLKKKKYEEDGKSPGLYACCKLLTELKKQDEFSWLNEIDSQSSKAVLKDLDNAFSKFFKKTGRYPRFKCKKDNSHSYRTTQCISVDIEKSLLKVPKFSSSLKFKGEIKKGLNKINSCTISKTPSGKYYASIQGVFDIEILPSPGCILGLDMGIREFLVDSNGKSYENPKNLDKCMKKIQYLNKQLSKKKKGSKSRDKARKKLAIYHEKVTNKRKDHLHKVSTSLISENQIICMEDFDIKDMLKSRRLAREIHDVSWGTFKNFMAYKASTHDRNLIIVDQFYPRNKICSDCKFEMEKISLDKYNHWECTNCGKLHAKNVNSAKNILSEGLKELSGCRSQSDIKQKAGEPPCSQKGL